MKRIRLIVTNKCNKNCVGCCNNHNIAQQREILDPKSQNLTNNSICITGGEPMLFPQKVADLIRNRLYVAKEIFLYTAYVKDTAWTLFILSMIDGITVTIHEDKDWEDFIELNKVLLKYDLIDVDKKSLRLNVFTKNNLPTIDLSLWQVRFKEWVKECTLPEDVLMELKETF